MKKLVSVIIPTHKGSETIDSCVKSVKESSYQNLDIIVVDRGLERSAQRNIGIDEARGDYILILDSDQLISSRLIEECVEKIKDNAGIYIPEVIIINSFFDKLRAWERNFYTGTCVDVVRFVHRYNCPKFDESMSGPEDSDWDRRIKGKRIISNNVLFHYDNMTFMKYLKKKAYYARSMAKYKAKWPDDRVLNFWYRFFGIYFENGKWKRVLKRPHYFICLMGLNIIRGIIYKWQTKSL